MSKFGAAIKKYIPTAAMIIYIITVVSAAIHVASILSESFADFFNLSVSRYIRIGLSYLTGWIPFSFAETIFLMIPVVAVILFSFCFIIAGRDGKSAGRFIASLLAVICCYYSVFVLVFATGYQGSSLASKLSISDEGVTAEQLKSTADTLAAGLEESEDGIYYRVLKSYDDTAVKKSSTFSYMPYTYEELNDKIIAAYDKLAEKYDFVHNFDSNVKKVALSEPLTYTHISGFYSFYTGEANINTNFPDYTIPFTMAHELAHQRGFAREDEASFIGFLACMESDDAYVRYSALLSMYEYVADALYTADSTLFYKSYEKLPDAVTRELAAYSDFFSKYRDSAASDVSGTINDTFLKLQGTEGTRSYGLVVDLAVAYYTAK